MNFKFTPLKVIISIIVGLIGGLIYTSINLWLGGNNISQFIVSGIIIAIIIYLICSLIQKKK